MLVGVGQRAGHVLHDAGGLAHGERAAREPRAERFAGDVGHEEVGQGADLSGAEHGDDVGMIEARHRHDLAAEPLDRHRRRQVGRQDLDDHVPREGGVPGEKHPRHAPAAELPPDHELRPQLRLQPLGQSGFVLRHLLRPQGYDRVGPGRAPGREQRGDEAREPERHRRGEPRRASSGLTP